MTSYENFIVHFGFRIQKYPPAPNLSKIKPISWKICKFLHFSIPRHIHNKRLPWQHLRLMRSLIMCKMIPISVGLNLKNFILISCAVLKLSKKVSQGGRIRPPPPGKIGLRDSYLSSRWVRFSFYRKIAMVNKLISCEKPFQILQNGTKMIKNHQA